MVKKSEDTLFDKIDDVAHGRVAGHTPHDGRPCLCIASRGENLRCASEYLPSRNVS